MDILRYSRDISYQDQGAKSGGDLGVSVEDLAYSMQQDLLLQQSTNIFDPASHSSSVQDNQYPDASHDTRSRPASSLSRHSPAHSYRTPHVESYHKSSPSMEYPQNGGMDYSVIQHSPVRHPNIQNHHVVEQVTFKKSAKSFYQELYGGQSENNNSVVIPTNSPGQRSHFQQDGSFDENISPRMLPKPPMEPRRSKTRSSLRRAAKALLNRSRQNLSEPEPKTRKPEKPPPPADGKLKRSGSIRDKLKENRNKMAEVLKKPAFMRRYSQGNEHAEDSQSVSSNHNSSTSVHHYGSAGNLHPYFDDVDDTAPAPVQTMHQHSNPTQQRYSSMDNVRPNFPSNEAIHTPQSRQIRAFSNSSASDLESPQNYLQTYNHHPRLLHSSTSDLETSGSESRSHGSRELIGVRSESPGYQLRRHSSGPVYNTTSPRENIRRGYHTADSDTDSSISRHDGYWPQSNRHDARRPLPSTKDTLRMLQKKREGALHSPRGMTKVHSGPLRADHNIQAVRKDDSFGSPVELGKDPWMGQGARPKRTQSSESLETEEICHEILPDTAIRVDNQDQDQSGERQSRNPNYPDSAMSGRSRQRAPSPSRSVHFEDSNSSPQHVKTSPQHVRTSPQHAQHVRTSNSRTPLRSALPNTTKHRPRRSNSDSSPYDSEYSTTSEVVEPPQQYRDVAEQNRNNSGYANPVMDAELHGGIGTYYGQRQHIGSVSGEGIHASDPSGPGRGSQPESRSSTPVPQYANVLDVPDRSRPNSRGSHRTDKKDKSNRKRGSSQPPPGSHKASTMRHAGSRESIASTGSNPCVVMDADDRITHVGSEIDSGRGQSFTSDLDNYSDLSSSRLSIASRTSISDKVQSIGHATKKKFHSMRRALSLDRIDKTGRSDEGPKLKKSPSLRSLTNILGKKKTKKDDSESEYPAKLDKKHRSASVQGLYNRPQRSTNDTDVTSPSHGRKVGKLLSRDPDGSQVIELVKPPAGPFGFYIARGTYDFGSGIFVTRLGDGHPAKILVGLMGVGDEILEINGESVRTRPIDDVYDIMMDNDTLVLKIMPLMARKLKR